MGKKSLTRARGALVLASCLGMSVLLSPVFAQSPGGPVVDQEAAHRRMATMDAMQQLQQARSAYTDRRYTEAVDHYRNALSVLPKGRGTAKLEKFIRESLSDALVARAIDYRSVGRVEEALEFLKEAIELSPQNERAKKELVYTEDPVRTNPALTPRHVGDVEEVNRLLSWILPTTMPRRRVTPCFASTITTGLRRVVWNRCATRNSSIFGRPMTPIGRRCFRRLTPPGIRP